MNLNENEVNEISIVTLTGQMVKQIMASGKTIINIADMSEGVYFINIKDDINTYRQKLVIR